MKEENGSLSLSPSDNRPPVQRVRLARLQDRKVRKALFVSGQKAVSNIMVIYFQENNIGRPRYAVYASKRLGSAVQRNRVKRVFREAIYRHKKELKGHDFIIIPREAAKDMGVHEAATHVGKIFLDKGMLK